MPEEERVFRIFLSMMSNPCIIDSSDFIGKDTAEDQELADHLQAKLMKIAGASVFAAQNFEETYLIYKKL